MKTFDICSGDAETALRYWLFLSLSFPSTCHLFVPSHGFLGTCQTFGWVLIVLQGTGSVPLGLSSRLLTLGFQTFLSAGYMGCIDFE